MEAKTSPPAAPIHSRQEIRQEVLEEDEEVLVVTTDHGPGPDISTDVTFQLQLTVDRMKSDLGHLQSRLGSVETIVALRENHSRESSRSDWWPFQDLAPKTVLFMVTWPIISQGLIQLAKVAFRKSRK